MKWLWTNQTQVGFGAGAVKDHLAKFVKPNSKVLCIFGGGSIDRNGARADTQSVLDSLGCTTIWAGGVLANPEYDRLMEIVAIVRAEQPDLLLAVGGGSVLDGTKFISVAAKLEPEADAWNAILRLQGYPSSKFDVGSVLTLPATGSEWNSNFVISRHSLNLKLSSGHQLCYPVFSLLDPTYTMTLPARQLRNGVFDAIVHCIDQFLIGQEIPMFDGFWMVLVKELVDIGPLVVQDGSSLELRSRLMVAASFALNGLFCLGKDECWAIHEIGHTLTAKYDIDHGATLSIVAPIFLETQIEPRKSLLSQSAEFIFGVKQGTVEDKARAFVEKLREFIVAIGLPLKVSDWPGVAAQDGDVDELVDWVWEWNWKQPFGWRGCVTKELAKEIVQKALV
jgi:alcohol dehydrogenase YqhD (iron-dependent ADH family)